MIDFRILNRSKSKTAMFIHGLFATAGFWLPYLDRFRDFRLILLNIDYRNIGGSYLYLDEISDVISSQAGGRVDAMVSHSLGTLIASRLPHIVYRQSFEVCPVYVARRLQPEAFADLIRQKLSHSMVARDIINIFSHVDSTVYSCSFPENLLGDRTKYIPDSDFYFTYCCDSHVETFRGDHFDIMSAIKSIERALAE